MLSAIGERVIGFNGDDCASSTAGLMDAVLLSTAVVLLSANNALFADETLLSTGVKFDALMLSAFVETVAFSTESNPTSVLLLLSAAPLMILLSMAAMLLSMLEMMESGVAVLLSSELVVVLFGALEMVVVSAWSV